MLGNGHLRRFVGGGRNNSSLKTRQVKMAYLDLHGMVYVWSKDVYV
jgi:hypothetical protein